MARDDLLNKYVNSQCHDTNPRTLTCWIKHRLPSATQYDTTAISAACLSTCIWRAVNSQSRRKDSKHKDSSVIKPRESWILAQEFQKILDSASYFAKVWKSQKVRLLFPLCTNDVMEWRTWVEVLFCLGYLYYTMHATFNSSIYNIHYFSFQYVVSFFCDLSFFTARPPFRPPRSGTLKWRSISDALMRFSRAQPDTEYPY